MFLSQIRMYPNDRSIPVSTPPSPKKNPRQRYQSFTTDTSFTHDPALLRLSSTAFSTVRARLTIFSLMERRNGTLPFEKYLWNTVEFLSFARVSAAGEHDPRRMTRNVCVRTRNEDAKVSSIKLSLEFVLLAVHPRTHTHTHTHTRARARLSMFPRITFGTRY